MTPRLRARGATIATMLLLFGCAEGTPATPAIPSKLTAVAGNQTVTLAWKTESDVQYTLYWSHRSPVDETATAIVDVQSPYVHGGRENELRVYYRVLARNGFAASPLSAEVTAVPRANATAPDAPASMTAVAGDGRVTISWRPVPGATRYTVYRDTNPGVRPSLSTVVGEGDSPYIDHDVTNDITYYYVVTGWLADVQGPPSAEVSAMPTASTSPLVAPKNLAAAAANGSVTLTWDAVPDAQSYTLYWSTAVGVTPQNGTAIANVSSPYIHASVSNGQTYHYVVTALRGGQESAPSSAVSATPTGSVAPTSPSSVSAVAGDGLVTISWTGVSGATSYAIYWSTSPGVTPQNGTAITNATSPYLHTPLTNGQPYYYVVTALDANGESPPSTEVGATPTASASVPGMITSTLSAGAYAVVLLENLTNGTGIVQLMVYTSDPQGAPAGTGISGLTVNASHAITGALTPTGSAGVYGNTTANHLLAGTYVFTVSGARSGIVTATVSAVPSCTVTTPANGSTHLAGTDLPLQWTSTNSQKATILLQDSQGTVSYPPLVPDPRQALVPGTDIPYKGPLSVVVSAVWAAKASSNNAGLLFIGDGGAQITLN